MVPSCTSALVVAREGEGGAALRGRRWTVLAGSLRGDWGLSGSDLSGTQPRFCEYTSTLLALVLAGRRGGVSRDASMSGEKPAFQNQCVWLAARLRGSRPRAPKKSKDRDGV